VTDLPVSGQFLIAIDWQVPMTAVGWRTDREFYEDDDDEGPFEVLLRHAARIEAALVNPFRLCRSPG
jgi:hypothetical protein